MAGRSPVTATEGQREAPKAMAAGADQARSALRVAAMLMKAPGDIEPAWGDLLARLLAHQTFADLHVLDHANQAAVAGLGRQRTRTPLAKSAISA